MYFMKCIIFHLTDSIIKLWRRNEDAISECKCSVLVLTGIFKQRKIHLWNYYNLNLNSIFVLSITESFLLQYSNYFHMTQSEIILSPIRFDWEYKQAYPYNHCYMPSKSTYGITYPKPWIEVIGSLFIIVYKMLEIHQFCTVQRSRGDFPIKRNSLIINFQLMLKTLHAKIP